MGPRRALLHANFGAEEGRDAKKASRELRRLLALWRGLFPADTGVELPLRTFAPGTRAALEPQLCGPGVITTRLAREAHGLVPWLSDGPAAARAEALGLPLWGPPPEVVRRVHDKAFALRWAGEIAPSVWTELAIALSPEDLREAGSKRRIESIVSTWPAAWRERFVLKPRLGTSGRGRLVGENGEVSEAARRGLPRLAERGGAVLEPWVDRVVDLSAQLWVGGEGVEVLGLTRQILGRNGTYLGNAGIIGAGRSRIDLEGRPEWGLLHEAARGLGEAARDEGFIGPCGVDAFLYRPPDGRPEDPPRIRPLVELNARFTTGTLALAWLEDGLRGMSSAGPWEWCFLFAPEAAVRLLGEAVLPRESEGWRRTPLGPDDDPAWLALRPVR